ncbi:hypothetical protein ACS0TY_036154 [Phlomoides rotata]
MKNVVVLCLVYASLVSAGFFRSKDDARVDKEGVVIGIEDDNGNTIVKISPHEVDPHEKGVFSDVKEKIKEASSNVLPDMGRRKEAAEKAANEAVEKGYTAEESAKEGVGKVKDRVAQATQKASDKARESTEKAANEAVEKGYTAEEAAKGGVGEVKDRVAQVTQKASDKARESTEKTSEMKEGVKEKGKAAEERVKAQVKRAFGYLVSPFSFSRVLHLLGFSTAYGMCVWVTFGSNFVLSKALPRQQLAMVQSRVYPVYFKAMAASVGMAFVGYIMDKGRLGAFRGFDLVASLLMILANLLYLEPRATKVLFERMRKEKEEGGHADVATGEEKKHEEEAAAAGGGQVQNVRNVLLRTTTNSYSSILNIATLMSLTWHLVHLGQNAHAEC